MSKTLFEQFGGAYTQQGDYLLPDVTLPEQDNRPIGIWGCGSPVETSERSSEALTEPTGEKA